mgnify:CR=1 FL=1
MMRRRKERDPATALRGLALVLCIAAMVLIAGRARADEALPGLDAIALRWSEIGHLVPPDGREAAYDALLNDVDALVRAHPERAEPLAWKGIVLAAAARADGGLAALDRAKTARDLLLMALHLDDHALNGAIQAALGQLYYRAPRWPLGFGDQDTALEYFRQALAIDPGNLDANYFMADYLAAHDEDHEALIHARKALAAPPRPALDIADTARRAETRALLSRIERRLASAAPKHGHSSFWDSEVVRAFR